eukprot:NODE_409_length_7945_cov_0.205710.p3 type:complete len:196 gc:universal NODE_409_length_7945_cov_0.205710:6702-6115(-)
MFYLITLYALSITPNDIYSHLIHPNTQWDASHKSRLHTQMQLHPTWKYDIVNQCISNNCTKIQMKMIIDVIFHEDTEHYLQYALYAFQLVQLDTLKQLDPIKAPLNTTELIELDCKSQFNETFQIGNCTQQGDYHLEILNIRINTFIGKKYKAWPMRTLLELQDHDDLNIFYELDEFQQIEAPLLTLETTGEQSL